MSIGQIILVFALILFFLAAVASPIIPNPASWGFVALTLGILLSGVPITIWKRPQQ